jgi:Na+(H+)/acetate symporter ActP
MLFAVQGASLIMLIALERVGAPLAFIEWATLFSVWLGVCVAGLLGATMRPSGFFGTDKNAGFVSIGAAHFMIAMMCFTGTQAHHFTIGINSFIIVGLALAIYGFAVTPFLRRIEAFTGIFTITGFMRERFTYRLPAICICGASFISLGLMALASFTLTTQSLDTVFGVSFDTSLVFVGFVAIISVFVGGLRSILNVSLVICAAIILGFIGVSALSYFNLGTLPFNSFLSADMLAQIQKKSQLEPVFTNTNLTHSVGITLGLIGLMPLFGMFNAHKSQSQDSKRYKDSKSHNSQSNVTYSLIITFLCLCAAMLAIHSANLNLFLNMDSQKSDTILALPLALNLLYQLLPALIGVGGLCLSLFGLSTILGHDIFYKLIMPKSVASWRLAIIRILWVLSFILIADIFQIFELEAVFLLHLSLGVAASLIAPVLLLSFLPRTGSVTALMTLFAGASAAIIMMFIAPDAPLSAGFAGFAAACFIGAAGLASCPPIGAEHAFAVRLAANNDETLIKEHKI